MATESFTDGFRARLELPLLIDRAWLRLGRFQRTWAAVLFGGLSVAYFGSHVITHLGQRCVCTGRIGDPITYMWLLAWWPHQLLHGHDPFVTSALFAPGRVDIGAVATMPGPALLVTPITLLFGPLVSYNLLALAAPVLAAYFAFSLCRYVTGSFSAALLGGYIFGFSPYMLGHLLGHLDLSLIFAVPACVHLTLRLIDRQIGTTTFVCSFTLLMSLLLLTSPEITATFVLTGLLTLGLGAMLAPERRRCIARALPYVLGAGALAALLTSAFIYEALTDGRSQVFFNNFGDRFGADGLGYLIPTTIVRLGGTWFSSVASRFRGQLPENGVYIGVPMALILARYLTTRWSRPATKILAAGLGLVIVLMLGSHLRLAGYQTIPLPWHWIGRLPLFREMVPLRFGVFMFLIVALVAALWFASPRSGRIGHAKWALALLAIVSLVPNISAHLWRSRPDNPRLFTTTAYRSVLKRQAIVLALPFADNGSSMLWQAETGFWFRLPEGYLGALFPADYSAVVANAMFANPPGPPDPAKLRTFMLRRHVRQVVVDAARPEQWPATLARLGLEGRRIAGTLVYTVPPGFR